MVTAFTLMAFAIVVLAMQVYTLKARVEDLEKQADADRQFSAWQDRVFETAVLCEARHKQGQVTEDTRP